MQVKVGRNSEFGRHKVDVLIEEVDLARTLAEAGISPADAEKLTPNEVFLLMLNEAEWFAEAQWLRVEPEHASREAMDQFARSREGVLASVRKRLGYGQREHAA
jgi:hypothetical protein